MPDGDDDDDKEDGCGADDDDDYVDIDGDGDGDGNVDADADDVINDIDDVVYYDIVGCVCSPNPSIPFQGYFTNSSDSWYVVV